MSAVVPFQISLRRQPGYELLLTIRFEVKKKFAGVLTLSQPGWSDDSASRSKEYRDVKPSELRGGRFTLVHDGSERREGYSLARVTEPLLGRIAADEWTPLDPITEFGFRYLLIPEAALAATPAAAAVRTNAPTAPPTPVPPAAKPSRTAASRPASRGSLLARARHSATRQPSNPPRVQAAAAAAAPATAAQENTQDHPSPPPGLLAMTTGANVRVNATGEVEVRSGPSLPPKPKPVATASKSGTPAPSRQRAPHSLPGAVPAAPVPVEASLVDLALSGLEADELRERLRVEMSKVQDLHVRLAEAERRLADSLDREHDLLGVLQTWQERMKR